MLIVKEHITSPPIHFQNFLQQLQKVKNNFFSGSLIVHLHNNSSYLVFNFYLGRLNWSGSSLGQLDSWRRQLGTSRPWISEAEISALATIYQPASVSATLVDLLAKQKINRQQLNDITAAIFVENLFDVIQFSCVSDTSLHYEWVASTEQIKTLAKTLPLLSIKQQVISAMQKWQFWQGRGLSNFYLNLPIQVVDLEETAELTLTEQQQKLLPYLVTGPDLRTLASSLRQPTAHLAEVLWPLVINQTINLLPPAPAALELPLSIFNSSALDLPTDHSLKIDASPPAVDPEPPIVKPPLIFCIDDSEMIFHQLRQILIPYHYQVMGIQDSTQAIPALIRTKPDLIFLDLMMPIANGYEICTQIRRTPSLAKIPVIILTGRDGLIDKLRAKMVGSNDFLPKPIDPESVLKMLFYYLPVE